MKSRGFISLFVVYLVSGVVAVAVGTRYSAFHPIATVALADFAATLVVFICSMLMNNSSVYDPYWSVAPVLIALFYSRWLSLHLSALQIAMAALIVVWSFRLTANFLRRWSGISHEDWRYVSLRNRTGNLYWLVSFLGIHFLPTIVVFVGCIPLYFAFTNGPIGFTAISTIGILVTAGAIILESVADLQMDSFLKKQDQSYHVYDRGLWGVVRHPNYLGEILFWWGIWLFSLAASPGVWTIIAPVLMTVLFIAVSIPMIERRLSQRRDSYEEYRKRVPALLPLPKGRFGVN